MDTIVIVKHLTTNLSVFPFLVKYTIAGWGDTAGEVYDLKNGQFLALCNSRSTGYSRKVCKTYKTAQGWIERKLVREFPCNTVEFGYSWD